MTLATACSAQSKALLDVKLFIFMLSGFFWGGLTAPVSIKLAGLYGILDIPNARKIHHGNMPRGGGLGLWLGYMLLALILSASKPELRFLATGATIIFLCGYLDDMCSLSPYLRLILHLGSACLVIIPLGLDLTVSLVAIIWLAGVTSAYNLIDGLNGLCITTFIASSIALYFLWHEYVGVYMAAMAVGILCWNFPSAQTFLGDGGSTLLGYLFASHFLSSALPSLRGVGFLEVVLVLVMFGGVPVMDTLTAFTRRILAGKSPFYPDKKHLHHILITLTGSNILTVSLILALQVIMLVLGMKLYSHLS